MCFETPLVVFDSFSTFWVQFSFKSFLHRSASYVSRDHGSRPRQVQDEYGQIKLLRGEMGTALSVASTAEATACLVFRTLTIRLRPAVRPQGEIYRLLFGSVVQLDPSHCAEREPAGDEGCPCR